MLLSVIVPIYKVEKYINECVDSLVYQSLENIEIILVDDGSPDHCPTICDEYAARYDNVKVIHKTNGGIVSARKEGFRYCHGAYVTFVDGDDWVEKDYFKKVIALMDEYSPDMLCITRYFEAEDHKEFFIREQTLRSGLYNRCMLEKEIFPQILYQPPFFSFGVVPSIWSKFIKHEFLLDLLLDEPEEIKMGDDLAVTLPCMLKADSIYFSDICGYYYRQSPSSITHTFDSTAPIKVNSLLNYLCKKTEAYDGYNIKNQISLYAVHILQHTITSLIQGSNHIRDDLKLMNTLWQNALVKKGLKNKVPLKIKLLILATKSRQAWILKIIKKRWASQEEKGVKV